MYKILDMGCGKKKRPGTIGIDIGANTDADIILNLNETPYPFEESSIDAIWMDNVLEHLNDPIRVLEELARILKPNAKLIVIVPYFRSKWAFIDPTHRHFFTVDYFNYFRKGHQLNSLYSISEAHFKIEKMKFNDLLSNGIIKRLVIYFANRFPTKYEYYFSHIYPLDQLTFTLLNDK